MTPLRARSFQQLSIWIGACVVGVASVFYAKAIAYLQACYFGWFSSHWVWVTVFGPFGFVLATALVKLIAPDAKGSGIPQVLEAIENGKNGDHSRELWRSPLISVKTALIKILSSLTGILGGASIGREGPTVQIAASAFASVGRLLSKRFPETSFQSFLTAGAAAGVAAAFNTPLAGITFAIEEISDGLFGPFKQITMLAVIISGIVARFLVGDYLYFGHPAFPAPDFGILPQSLLLGILAGAFGGIFARILAFPAVVRLPRVWWKRAFLCGVACALIGVLTHGDTAGSGYEVTKRALASPHSENALVLFPVFKLATTILSYLSGMAGGIFSPSLAIGAGVGISVAKIAHFANFKPCALLGMVGFFSGAIQAPFTAVVIVMEMSNDHVLILPFLIAAFLAQAVGKLFLPVPLYRFLAQRKEEA